jgi:sarcosine oxidase subunit alpha/sarcosine oxidase subunit delta
MYVGREVAATPAARRSPEGAEFGVSLKIPCPNCGPRRYTEFTFGGELRDLESPDPDRDFDRVYLRENKAGKQIERWFHTFGCRRWFTLTRDTVTNRIEP